MHALLYAMIIGTIYTHRLCRIANQVSVQGIFINRYKEWSRVVSHANFDSFLSNGVTHELCQVLELGKRAYIGYI